MPDVIIVGGGLTGLAAAWECETLTLDYTLIEVKPRLGGSIRTERRDGFILDRTAFIIEKYGAWDFLDPLGLADALRYIGRYRDGRLTLFKNGTQTLIDALVSRLTHPIMMRMAVSSVGTLDPVASAPHYGICLENGLLLDARAVIITAPARHLAHMLYALNPNAALCFDDYQYDSIARVHLGYRASDLDPTFPVADSPPSLKYIETYDHADRVPPEHVLIRAGIRLENSAPLDADALIALTRTLIPTHAEPVLSSVAYWAEADPLTRHLPEFAAIMDQAESLLPPTIAIAGSDYRAKRLDQQVNDGRAAAQKIAAALKSS